MIEAKNISLVYGDGTKALKEVNLHIKRGEIAYITGLVVLERLVY